MGSIDSIPMSAAIVVIAALAVLILLRKVFGNVAIHVA